MTSIRKSFTIFFLLLIFSFLGAASAFCAEEDAENGEDTLLGVWEGWSWPIVVIQPQEGWDSEIGETIKLGMRTAERELSLEREAIRGHEVTFMFSSLSDRDGAGEMRTRLDTWRTMRVAAIVTFADADFSAALAELCAEDGPSFIFAGGEDAFINSPETGRPYPYLFALELPYYARANAIAEAASLEYPGETAAVFTDILSGRLAQGASLTAQFLRRRNLTVFELSASAYTQDHFTPQIRELESGGTNVYVSWLDAMATLSIWQNLERRQAGSTVYYSGPQRRILTDAEGIILVDQNVLLERNMDGRTAMTNLIRDAFGVTVSDPVTAARAYAVGKWVIEAFREVGEGDIPGIANSLGRVRNIPLMDEMLSINPTTHRPRSRKYGLLRIENRRFESHGSVDVFSSETVE